MIDFLNIVAFVTGWGVLSLLVIGVVFNLTPLFLIFIGDAFEALGACIDRARERDFRRKYGRTVGELRVTFERLDATMRSPREWPDWVLKADPWTRIKWASEQRELLRNIQARLRFKGERTDIKLLTFAGIAT